MKSGYFISALIIALSLLLADGPVLAAGAGTTLGHTNALRCFQESRFVLSIGGIHFCDDAIDKDGLTRRDLRRAIKREKYEAALADPGTLTGRFRVVYADPPSTMKTEDLGALPVPAIVEDNAVLFLWTTAPMLKDAFRIIEAWGFDYKMHFVWDKQEHNFGYYCSVRHELLLVATRRRCLPETEKLHDSVISIKRRKTHSQKPEYFRELIDKLYPSGSRIELFARKGTDGWDAWDWFVVLSAGGRRS